ncbi:MAG: dihydropteroate synthase [Isosphaeraceae bacterium]
MPRWVARGRVVVDATDATPKIMGVLNVTPDSFSDGGKHADPLRALDHARALAAEGADLLDVGGESSRPGSEPVPLQEELRRVLPTVVAIAANLDLPISVDTTKSEVARLAIQAGASIVNDISALQAEPELARVVAETGAGLVLMHMRGVPRTMQDAPEYLDVVADVHEFLARRIEAAEAAGVPRDRIAVDPGIGFGKTVDHNLSLLRNLGRFASLGCVVLVGTSRKRFLGAITGREIDGRATASAVSSLFAATQGAQVLRVHDVHAMSDALKVWDALGGWKDRRR